MALIQASTLAPASEWSESHQTLSCSGKKNRAMAVWRSKAGRALSAAVESVRHSKAGGLCLRQCSACGETVQTRPKATGFEND